MRPGRMLFSGLILLYLLAYLRGTALLVVLAMAAVGLLWRTRHGRAPAAAGAWAGWDANNRSVTEPLTAEVVEPDGGWPPTTTVVQGVPEPVLADHPSGFAVLVELRDRAGRQAMLQLEAAHPGDVDLERLVHQALSQAAGRAGWQLQRWQPVTDDLFASAGWDGAEGWDQ